MSKKKSEIPCPACGTRWSKNPLHLINGFYECGCGYAVSKSSLEG